MSPWTHTFSPKPRRGELESAMAQAGHEGAVVFEVWCHPDDTAGFLDGGIRTLNGVPVSVELVDSLPFADQLRIIQRRGASTPVGHRRRDR
jgi:hypothetical protein